MSAYYNEIDPFCCEWLQNLMDAGQIPAGDIDSRSIADVSADEVRNYDQAHYFAGISGWSLALRLAGWEEGRRCWSGSCPCQGLSAAGKRKAEKDARHLWPEFYRLISACRPLVVFGEQVASVDGRRWFGGKQVDPISGAIGSATERDDQLEFLPGIRTDLERAGYVVGAANLPAGMQAPHIRQRLFFVAFLAESDRQSGGQGREVRGGGDSRGGAESRAGSGGSSVDDGMDNSAGSRHASARTGESQESSSGQRLSGERRDGVCTTDQLGDPDSRGPASRFPSAEADGHGRASESDGRGVRSQWMGDSRRPTLQRRSGPGEAPGAAGEAEGEARQRERSGTAAGADGSPWSDYRIIHCRDGKSRRAPTEPELFCLAARIPKDMVPIVAALGGLGIDPVAAKSIIMRSRKNRVGRLRGYGNSVVSQVAAEFVRAAMECMP